MKARTILTLALLVFLGVCIVGLASVSCTQIDPGHVGVSVDKCRGGGVNQHPIPTGYYWKSIFCEDVIEYPTNLQTIVLTKSPAEGSKSDDSITVTSSEGLPISVDVSLSFTLDPNKVPTIYTKYRAAIKDITHTFIRQTVREGLQATFAKYTAEQLYSDKKEPARAEIQAFLTEKLGVEGFVVSQYTMNELRVPTQVTEAINAKVAMTQEAQKAEAAVRRTKAEAEQRKAQAEGEASALRLKADAEAYYNQTVAKSLTPEYITYKSLEKWDGQLPQVNGGGSVPFIQIPMGAKGEKKEGKK